MEDRARVATRSSRQKTKSCKGVQLFRVLWEFRPEGSGLTSSSDRLQFRAEGEAASRLSDWKFHGRVILMTIGAFVNHESWA